MKKTLYIIPGWGEYSRYKVYQSFAELAKKKGYEVFFYDVDWNKTLSSQIFPVKKGDVVFGFSLGAIFGHLIAQKYECRVLILASMTPLYSFKDKKIKKQLIDLLGNVFIGDIIKKLTLKHRAKKQVVMYGDRENESGDIIVRRTGHRLNAEYNKEILELL